LPTLRYQSDFSPQAESTTLSPVAELYKIISSRVSRSRPLSCPRWMSSSPGGRVTYPGQGDTNRSASETRASRHQPALNSTSGGSDLELRTQECLLPLLLERKVWPRLYPRSNLQHRWTQHLLRHFPLPFITHPRIARLQPFGRLTDRNSQTFYGGLWELCLSFGHTNTQKVAQ
jgi:hypothetical protein